MSTGFTLTDLCFRGGSIRASIEVVENRMHFSMQRSQMIIRVQKKKTAVITMYVLMDEESIDGFEESIRIEEFTLGR